MKPLNINELSTEQKIGQLIIACCDSFKMDKEYIFEMLRDKRIGGVEVNYPSAEKCREEIAAVNEAAGYPVLVCRDMEQGCPGGEYKIPSMLALGITGDEELAYQFGAVTAIEAKSIGYNTVWGPQVDLIDGNAMFRIHRCLGENADFVGKMASAILRGYQDNGMVTTAKHWPSPGDKRKDGHLFENVSEYTKADLVEKTFAPYRYAIKAGQLTGVMTTHTVIPKSDSDYPTTLSEKNVAILREEGFDGLVMTDSLGMTGFLSKFGTPAECAAMAIKAGHDMVLIDRVPIKEVYESLLNAYRKGVFSEERLNDAVRRVIAAQNRTLRRAAASVSEYQAKCMERITREGVCTITSDGVKAALNNDTTKLFIVLVDNLYHSEDGKPILNGNFVTYEKYIEIRENILKKFPKSDVMLMNCLPSQKQIYDASYRASLVDEVVFITNSIPKSYAASENLTEHIIVFMESVAKKISAIVHIGNPFASQEFPHSPRVLLICGKEKIIECVDSALLVLSGDIKPIGKMSIDLRLQ